MSPFRQPLYTHSQTPITGILLTNLGTPQAPTPAALRRYLAEFLSDRRVVELPRWLWWLILHAIILRVRPARSARAYKKIWTPEGSPLLQIARQQEAGIRTRLEQAFSGAVAVELGMRYGQPSIQQALERLRAAGVNRLLVLPLYPQYSSATVGSTFDAVSRTLQTWRWLPELRFISHYHEDSGYIQALAETIRSYWQQHGRPDKLLLSFHGIPQRTFLAGDPYHCECHKTARLVAEQLELAEGFWQVTFQSRFGREEWLKPYTDHQLQALGAAGVRRVDLVCPGFSADCLETLEEIAHENRALFLQAGGQAFHYIPALNADPAHLDALTQLIMRNTQDWLADANAQAQTTTAKRIERAQALAAQLGIVEHSNQPSLKQ